MTTLAIFIWTFDGVCKAIALAFVVLCFLIVGIIVGLSKIGDWWMKKKLRFKASLSIRKMRTCEWCGSPSRFKLKWIYSKGDPIGSLRPVCDECVKNCKKG